MRHFAVMPGTLATLGACLALVASVARADRVHLVDGAVIEGKATRSGDKVVIELESGQITLAASDVAKIEASLSAVQRYEELEGKHRGRGVAGLMFLADYCRDHGMRARERSLLESVLEKQPDHGEARARLGFVKTEAGWITREEHMRAQGMVLDGNEFITRDQQLEREQRRGIERDRAEAAKHERERAKLEVEQQRLALAREQLELRRQQQRAEAEPAASSSAQAGYHVYGASYGDWHECHKRQCRREHQPRKPPFPIPGVRDPRDPSWPIAGVKDPRSY